MRPLNKAVFDDLKYDTVRVLGRCFTAGSSDSIWTKTYDMQMELSMAMRFEEHVRSQLWSDLYGFTG